MLYGINRRYSIIHTYKPMRTSKLSTLAQKLSKPQNPRQFHLLVAKYNSSATERGIIAQVKPNLVLNSRMLS